jgi:hypothetical protein
VESASSCGASCTACQEPPNSTASCTGGTCGFKCNDRYAPCQGGTQCCLSPPNDGGPDAAACDATTSCLANVPIGTVRGDIGSDVVTMNGTTSEWLRVTVAEGDSSFPLVDLKFTAKLASPPGMDFNLYVYETPCGTGTYGQSTNPAGQLDTVTGGWADHFGSDDSRVVILEVRYASGGVCGASWTIEIDGNK